MDICGFHRSQSWMKAVVEFRLVEFRPQTDQSPENSDSHQNEQFQACLTFGGGEKNTGNSESVERKHQKKTEIIAKALSNMSNVSTQRQESEQGNWERFDALQNVTKLQLYFIVAARGTAATFKRIKHADVWFQISILFISYAMCSNILTSQVLHANDLSTSSASLSVAYSVENKLQLQAGMKTQTQWDSSATTDTDGTRCTIHCTYSYVIVLYAFRMHLYTKKLSIV